MKTLGVMCSIFFALVLKKELDHYLHKAGNIFFKWVDIKKDPNYIQKTTIEENRKRLPIRSECLDTGSKVFQAVGVATPDIVREI